MLQANKLLQISRIYVGPVAAELPRGQEILARTMDVRTTPVAERITAINEPQQELAAVTVDRADELAVMLARFNANGVPVIERFAREMNGSWWAWGQQPAEYIDAVRRVADAVHRDAPGSAMMWAPNCAGGYPFSGGAFESLPGAAGFVDLDTTQDGVLASTDDPYALYYPGDVVSRVVESLYHWGSTLSLGRERNARGGQVRRHPGDGSARHG